MQKSKFRIVKGFQVFEQGKEPIGGCSPSDWYKYEENYTKASLALMFSDTI